MRSFVQLDVEPLAHLSFHDIRVSAPSTNVTFFDVENQSRREVPRLNQDYSICEPGFVARAPGFVRVIHEPINYSKKTRLLKRLGFVRELSDCDPRYGLDTATRAQCCLAESALNRISSVMRVESMGIGKGQLEMGAE